MPNALLDAPSPYLRQHAHNPVDWHPWSDASLQLAKDQDKPIFLSIGYATCYWCHVMERQCFEHEGIARLMNDHFINIKVDREQRPDLDALYMTATQLTTGSGGWPMSVFLTPGTKPFFCATYLPPEPMHGRSSFPQVLSALADAWQHRRDQVIEQADHLADAVAEQHQPGSADPGDDMPEADLINRTVSALLQSFDPEFGGFGGAPKFPQASNLLLLLAAAQNPGTRSDRVHNALAFTLDRMARGGIYDHLGGGFHRYATDRIWLVPHFEKMLYDQGQLLQAYARFLQANPDDPIAPLCKRVLRQTTDYLVREMTDPTGAFWSAQDAEVDHREGLNYLWTAQQFREALPPEDAEPALRLLGLDRGTNFQDPHHDDDPPANVLFLPETYDPDDPLLQRVIDTLLPLRDQRKEPITDDKVLVAWNGMAILGLVEAAKTLDDPSLLEPARRAADTLLEHLYNPDTGLQRAMLDRQANTPAFLDDHAQLIAALLALHGAQPQHARSSVYLGHAIELAETVLDRFALTQGGYRDASSSDALFATPADTDDGATPSGAAVMLHALLDLYAATDDTRWLQRVDRDLHALHNRLRSRSPAMTHAVHALARRLQLPQALAHPHRATAEITHDPTAIQLTIPPGYHIDPDGLTADPDVLHEVPSAPMEGIHTLAINPPTPNTPIKLRVTLCTDDRCLPPQTLTVHAD
ncbi:MAG: thioredoxin domain-containing protein [Planctomycetota bacterium]